MRLGRAAGGGEPPGEVADPGEATVPDFVDPAALDEAVFGVLAQGLELPVPCAKSGGGGHDEGPRDEPVHEIDGVMVVEPSHGDDPVEQRATGEHRQRFEQVAFVRRQPVVGPRRVAGSSRLWKQVSWFPTWIPVGKNEPHATRVEPLARQPPRLMPHAVSTVTLTHLA